jgi:hypothetical protein
MVITAWTCSGATVTERVNGVCIMLGAAKRFRKITETVIELERKS